ncbi:MAG: hypothetical protein J0H83_17870 [Candidatus Melainabacteria bacterium]|nr:hypothetical protein [Candidatus Melainabacteria bacterium]
MILRVGENPEITGRIFSQYFELSDGARLTEDEKNIFMPSLISVMQKLHCVNYHRENYVRIEIERLQIAHALATRDPNVARTELELLCELQGFLFQIKSSLDILVKSLRVIPNMQVGIRTFSNRGKDLIKGLECYKRSKTANIRAADRLIKLLKSFTACFDEIIGHRDELNHAKTLDDYFFVFNAQNLQEFNPPFFKGRAPVEYINECYQKILLFHQDFISCVLVFFMPVDVVLQEVVEYENNQEIPVVDRYLRWKLLPRDRIKSDTQIPIEAVQEVFAKRNSMSDVFEFLRQNAAAPR